MHGRRCYCDRHNGYCKKIAGVNIPQNMAVIGYDYLELARFVNFALTTIRQPARKMSETAIDMIINGLENKRKRYIKKSYSSRNW